MPANEETEIPPIPRPEHLSWDTEQVEEYISDHAYTCDECSDTRLFTRVSVPNYANDNERYWYSLRLRHGAGSDNDLIFPRGMLEMIDYIGYSYHRGVEFENLGSHYDYLCEGCYDHLCERNEEEAGSPHVHSYGYRPNPMFFVAVENTVRERDILTPAGIAGKRSEASHHGRVREQFPVLGFELEMSDEGDDLGYSDCASYLNSQVGSFAYLKEDGSVSNGFELVTHPHTLDAYNLRTELWDALDYIRQHGWRSWKSSSSCGLHIHINTASFHNVGHAMMFLKFIYANRDPLVRFAGRDSSYARFDYDSFVQREMHVGWSDNGAPLYKRSSVADVVKKKQVNDNRYLAVNAQNSNTYELRFFKGSLNPKTVRACLEFTYSLHDYTSRLTSHDVLVNRALTWRPYLAFVRSQSKNSDFKYRNLYDRLLMSRRNPDTEFINSEQDD
jgi:hypothetical protein